MGTQSAVKIASTTDESAVTSTSPSGTDSSSATAPVPASAAVTTRTPGAVDLASEHEVAQVSVDRGGQAAAVLRDRGRVVAHAQPQVQGLIRAGGDPARPRGHERVRALIRERRPGQQFQPRHGAQRGYRGGGWLNGRAGSSPVSLVARGTSLRRPQHAQDVAAGQRLAVGLRPAAADELGSSAG